MLFCPPEEKICTFPSNVLQWRKTPEVFSMEELILYVKYQAKPGCRETFVRQIVEKGILTAIRQETREIDRTLKQELQEEQRELTQSARK